VLLRKGKFEFLDQHLEEYVQQLNEDNPSQLHAFKSPSAPGQYSGKALNFLLDTNKSNLNVLLEGNLFRLPLQNYKTLEKAKANKFCLTITVDENNIASIPQTFQPRPPHPKPGPAAQQSSKQKQKSVKYRAITGKNTYDFVIPQNFLLKCSIVEKPFEGSPYYLKGCSLVQQNEEMTYENPVIARREGTEDTTKSEHEDEYIVYEALKEQDPDNTGVLTLQKVDGSWAVLDDNKYEYKDVEMSPEVSQRAERLQKPHFLYVEHLPYNSNLKMLEAIRDRHGISIDHSGHVAPIPNAVDRRDRLTTISEPDYYEVTTPSPPPHPATR
jgi:hypothetical protein